MRYLELNESRAKIFVAETKNARLFFSQKKAPFPFVVVLQKGDNEFTVMGITAAGKKVFSDLALDYKYGRLADENMETLNSLIMYRQGMDSDADPSYVKQEDVSLTGLFKVMTSKYKFSIQQVEYYYGKAPDELEDDAILYKGTKLHFPDNASKRLKDATFSIVDELDNFMTKHNLTKLVDGNFRIGQISKKNTSGYYEITNGWVMLSQKYILAGVSLYTIIHELAHKWYYTDKLGQTIRDKYVELLRSGQRYSSYPDLRNGEKVKFSPSSKNRKFKGMDMVVREVKPTETRAYVPDLDRMVTIPTDMFMAREIITSDDFDVDMVNVNQWFPTPYSMTDHEEWFAECFVTYIYGTATPEVTKWFDNLPR